MRVTLNPQTVKQIVDEIRAESREPSGNFRGRNKSLAALGKQITRASFQNQNVGYGNFNDRFFCVSTGSLSRGSDFLLTSDTDSIVIPTNDGDDINTARHINKMAMSSATCLLEGVPISTNHHLSEYTTIVRTPVNLTGENLQPVYVIERPDIQESYRVECSKIHRALRDIEYLAGNRDEFDFLIRGVNERIYTGGNNEFNAQLKNEIASNLEKWTSPNADLKENILRTFQLTGWLLRSRNNTPDSRDFFDDIENSSLHSDDKIQLAAAFEHFLKQQEYLYWTQGDGKNSGEDIGLIVEKELKFTYSDEEANRHMENSSRIIRQLIA